MKTKDWDEAISELRQQIERNKQDMNLPGVNIEHIKGENTAYATVLNWMLIQRGKSKKQS